MIVAANFSAELFTDFDQQIYLLTDSRIMRSTSVTLGAAFSGGVR
jgi:hypothetical protein